MLQRVKKKGLQAKAKKVGAKATRMLDRATGEEVDDEDVDMYDEERAAGESSATSVTINSNSLSSKVIFAVRIRPSDAGTPLSVKRALASLRLRELHDGAFVRATPSSISST